MFHFIYRCVALFLLCVKELRQESFVIKNYNVSLSISSILFIDKHFLHTLLYKISFYSFLQINSASSSFSGKIRMPIAHIAYLEAVPICKTFVIPSLRFKRRNGYEKDCRECIFTTSTLLTSPLKKGCESCISLPKVAHERFLYKFD